MVHWANKKQHTQKFSVAEMRMLRWMCGKTKNAKVRNEDIRFSSQGNFHRG